MTEQDRPRGALALAVAAGFLAAYVGASLAGLGLGALLRVAPLAIGIAIGGGVLGGLGLAVLALLRPRSRRGTTLAGELALLVVLPVWGLLIDASLPVCDPCGDENRALAWPGVAAVFAVYGLGLAAWGAARWHPAPLRTALEAPLLAALMLGVGTTTLLSVQFGLKGQMLFAVAWAPVGLPLVSPPLISVLWGAALLTRGGRALQAAAIAAGAAATITVADAALHLALTGAVGLFGGAFASTCGWGLSQMVPPDVDCHYLCTVAAQGHPWLVRPLRVGVRHGKPIVVNRQLAVANAFEDLVHERWPHVGRSLRRTYDRYGWPIGRWLLHPLAADLVFLAMLPAQLGFELVLRALDRDPEARIDRMYR